MGFLSSIFGGGEPNEPLRKLMRELATRPTPRAEGNFYRTLLEARLRIATPGAQALGLHPGEAIAGEATKIRFVGSMDPQGRRAILAFTSEKTLLAWRPVGCDSVELKFPDLCRLALSANGIETVILDQGSAHCSVIWPAEVQEFAEGRAPTAPGEVQPQAVEGAIVFAPLPVEPPALLTEALQREAEPHPLIRSVVLVDATVGAGPSGPLIVLGLLTRAGGDEVVSKFASGAVVRLGGRPIPDILVSVDDDQLRDARAKGLLVYERR